MDRRQAFQAGFMGSGALLLGKQLLAEDFSALDSSAPRQDAQDIVASNNIVRHQGRDEYPKYLNFDSHAILENEIADAEMGFENWGKIGPGIHCREFNIPKGTHMIVGNVQEAGHYGEAFYQTLGVSLNQVEWRCRVVWRMQWHMNSTLDTYFYWKKFSLS